MMSCYMEQNHPEEGPERETKAYLRARKFLNTYKEAVEEYREILTRKLDLLHPEPRGAEIRADIVPSGIHSDLSDVIVRNEELIRMYDGRLAFLRKKMAAVRDAIEAVPDETDRKILSYKYIDFMSFGSISKKIKQNYEYVWKHHRDALEKLEYRQVFDDGGRVE